MRWQRIKITDKDPATVEIGYQLAVSGGYVDHLVTSPEAPHPDFVNAMAAIAGAVIEIAELKGVAEPEDITVRSISFGHKKAGRTSIIITALRALANSNGPLLINTPLKYILANDAEDEGTEDEKLDAKLALKIDLVCGEARAFIEDGKRAQGDLFQKPEARQNGRRPRAEDGFQKEQPELEMETIGETVGAVMEGLAQPQAGTEAAETDAIQRDGDSLIPATPTEAAEVEEIMSIAHAAPVLAPTHNAGSDGDFDAAFEGSANGDASTKESRKDAALEQVQSWLDYKEWCLSFGVKATRPDFEALIASRDPSEVRAGYRDPQMAEEREARKRAAQTVLQNAGVASDDDLLN